MRSEAAAAWKAWAAWAAKDRRAAIEGARSWVTMAEAAASTQMAVSLAGLKLASVIKTPPSPETCPKCTSTVARDEAYCPTCAHPNYPAWKLQLVPPERKRKPYL